MSLSRNNDLVTQKIKNKSLQTVESSFAQELFSFFCLHPPSKRRVQLSDNTAQPRSDSINVSCSVTLSVVTRGDQVGSIFISRLPVPHFDWLWF